MNKEELKQLIKMLARIELLSRETLIAIYGRKDGTKLAREIYDKVEKSFPSSLDEVKDEKSN